MVRIVVSILIVGIFEFITRKVCDTVGAYDNLYFRCSKNDYNNEIADDHFDFEKELCSYDADAFINSYHG